MASGALGTSSSLVRTSPRRKRQEPYTGAGAVTIKHPDGTSEVVASYGRQEFQRVVNGGKPRR